MEQELNKVLNKIPSDIRRLRQQRYEEQKNLQAQSTSLTPDSKPETIEIDNPIDQPYQPVQTCQTLQTYQLAQACQSTLSDMVCQSSVIANFEPTELSIYEEDRICRATTIPWLCPREFIGRKPATCRNCKQEESMFIYASCLTCNQQTCLQLKEIVMDTTGYGFTFKCRHCKVLHECSELTCTSKMCKTIIRRSPPTVYV